MENLTDLVKRMSISGDLNAKVQEASDQFGTDDESANLDRNQLDEKNMVLKLFQYLMKGMKLHRNKTENNHQGQRILYAMIGADWLGILMGREIANQS